MGDENSSHNNASMGSAGGSQNNEPSKLHFHSIVNDHHLDLVEEPPNVIVELTETDTMSEKMNGTSSGENICRAAQKEITHGNTLDGNSVLGVKRARLTDDDQQASVHIRYKFLSRESKKKLEQLLHHWSEWHAQHGSSTKDSNEILESGNETFFPALNVGPEKSSTMSFLMDDQVTKKQTMGTLSGDSVPLYDREFAFALTSSDGSTSDERVLESLNASRCFNCSSYNHSLKECPKPRDNAAVNNARKQFHSNKKQTVGPRVPSRYYQNSPCGKFDGLKPGSLDAETRNLLGLGELDPPPWLNRMREMGYPPGYLDAEDEEQPSGITIFDDEETKEKNEEIFKVDISEPQKKMSVCFPGINAPIPENADQSCWAAPQSTPSASNNQSNNRSNYSPELTPRGHSYYQRLSSGSSNGHFSGYANELNSFLSGYSHSNVELGPTPTYSSEFINPYSYPPFPLPPPWHTT